MNKKGIITTVIGSLGFICFAAILLALIYEKIDVQTFSVAGTSVIAFFTFLLSMFTKDSNKSHSFKTPGNPPDEDEGDTPG